MTNTLIQEVGGPGSARAVSAAVAEVRLGESLVRRVAFEGAAILIAVGYAVFLGAFWAAGPTRPGIDENAYLVAGRNVFYHGTPGFKPSDDFQFVGAMWVRTEEATFSP